MVHLAEMEKRYVLAVGLLSGFCVSLFLLRVLATGSSRYWFVPENLALAWISVFLAHALSSELKLRRWLSWQNLGLTLLWLIFLPNTWYVLTDFIHVYVNGEINQLYDIVLITSLVFSGFILGFTSLFIVHRQLYRRLGARTSGWAITGVLLLSSFAIYLGRDLRWNTWDVLKNPSGVILNVSDRVLDPFGHPRALNITALFFMLLGTMYLGIWLMVRPRHD